MFSVHRSSLAGHLPGAIFHFSDSGVLILVHRRTTSYVSKRSVFEHYKGLYNIKNNNNNIFKNIEFIITYNNRFNRYENYVTNLTEAKSFQVPLP